MIGERQGIAQDRIRTQRILLLTLFTRVTLLPTPVGVIHVIYGEALLALLLRTPLPEGTEVATSPHPPGEGPGKCRGGPVPPQEVLYVLPERHGGTTYDKGTATQRACNVTRRTVRRPLL